MTASRAFALGVSLIAFIGLIAPFTVPAASAAPPTKKQRARGEYLVTIMGCHDCHTPMKLGPTGPEPDMERALSGHPEGLVMPPAPPIPGPWGWLGAATNTAFAGPWGVSFTANLTPDPETGVLAGATAEVFIDTLRNGRHQGRGRPLLPPMPWPMYRNASDDDLKAIFAYLQSLAPVRNRVPQPLEPPATAK